MTGFAQVSHDTSAGELRVSVRSVNHRGLDLHFHQSHEFSPFENGMRSILKEHIGRGHVEIRAGLTRPNGTRGGLNTDTLLQYAELFRNAATALDLDNRPDLNALLTLPGVITDQSAEALELEPGFESLLLAALAECIGTFNDCRSREGVKLAEDMLSELQDVQQAAAEVKELRATILPSFHQRLQDKLRELLGGSNIPDSRIVEESAVLADRSDIQEEITRLSVHSAELQRILGAGGAIGKQIDFLLQEMNRETNTMLAKSSNAGDAGLRITTLALAIKANIERIREQALNLE